MSNQRHTSHNYKDPSDPPDQDTAAPSLYDVTAEHSLAFRGVRNVFPQTQRALDSTLSLAAGDRRSASPDLVVDQTVPVRMNDPQPDAPAVQGGISRTTYYRALRLLREADTVQPKLDAAGRKTGRPSKFTDETDQALRDALVEDPQRDLNALRIVLMNQCGVTLSSVSIGRRLKMLDLATARSPITRKQARAANCSSPMAESPLTQEPTQMHEPMLMDQQAEAEAGAASSTSSYNAIQPFNPSLRDT